MIGLFLSTLIASSSYAQQSPMPPTESIKTAENPTPEQKEVINLSNMKWDWMADKKVDSLETLFDDKAMFTHMGGTWGKPQELATIKSGGIWYKKPQFTQLMLAYLLTQPSCWRTLICKQ